MGNQRSKTLIDQVLDSKNREPYPSPETIYSLVHDAEDVVFIGLCSASWDWMKGRTKVYYRNNHSVLLLTRQRLIVVGGPTLPFQSFQQLGDIHLIREGRSEIVVLGARTIVNDPPNPPTEGSGYRSYSKDERDEITYELSLWSSSEDLREKLFKVLRMLPYRFFIRYTDRQSGGFRDVSLQLPLHQDIESWNLLNISSDALQTVAKWIDNGEAFPQVDRIKALLQENEGVFYQAKYFVEYHSPPAIIEIIPTRKNWWDSLKWKGNRKPLPKKEPVSFIALVTSQQIILINEQDSDDITSIRFDDIIEVVYEEEGYKYEAFYGKAFKPILEIYHKQQTISLRPSDGQDILNFLRAIQTTGHAVKVVTDKEIIPHGEYQLLRSFESVVTNETNARPNTIEKVPFKFGYVYILINPQLPSDTLKIGKTTRKPEERASEIFSTGVPGEFIVAYEEHVIDCDKAEAAIHSKLASYRISSQREFFRLPLKVAVKVVHEVAIEIGIID